MARAMKRPNVIVQVVQAKVVLLDMVYGPRSAAFLILLASDAPATVPTIVSRRSR